MKTREIARALDVSLQAVHQRAAKEGWRFRTLNKRGDKDFIRSALPEDVRMKIRGESRQPPASSPISSGVPSLAEMARGYLNFWAGIFRALGRAFVWANEHRS